MKQEIRLGDLVRLKMPAPITHGVVKEIGVHSMIISHPFYDLEVTDDMYSSIEVMERGWLDEQIRIHNIPSWL